MYTKMIPQGYLISLLLFTGAVNSYAQSDYPPPGKLVDVNGYKLHLIVEGSDGPPVVMFHGAGDIALIWNLVLPKVSKFTTAVAVDQAGEGWSEHGHAVNMRQQAYDTYTALQNAGIKGPYILVGHSLGGILVRVFAEAYPKAVAGVVLVDATHPDVVLKIYKEGKASWKQMRLTASEKEIPEPVRTPLTKQPEVKTFQPKRDFGDRLKNFSKRDRALFQWFYNERPYSYVPGRKSFEAETMQALYENPIDYSFGDKPLIVISGGNKDDQEGDSNWSTAELRAHSEKLQKDLLRLSTNSEQIIARKSGHQVHLDESGLVAKAIKSVIKKLKSRD